MSSAQNLSFVWGPEACLSSFRGKAPTLKKHCICGSENFILHVLSNISVHINCIVMRRTMLLRMCAFVFCICANSSRCIVEPYTMYSGTMLYSVTTRTFGPYKVPCYIVFINVNLVIKNTVQWNLVMKSSDITKPSYNKVILVVPALCISLFFSPWYNEKPDTRWFSWSQGPRHNEVPL